MIGGEINERRFRNSVNIYTKSNWSYKCSIKLLESIHQDLSKAFWSSEVEENILGASEGLCITVANLVAMKASLVIRELKVKVLLS